MIPSNRGQIDLNADLGEGCPYDSQMMPFLSSANIACGFHAGDPQTMAQAIEQAVAHNVSIGAHPGFPDKENFGREELSLTPQAIYEDCVYQIGALQALCQTFGKSVRYLKPHGALYNMACRDEGIAKPIIACAQMFEIPVLGLPNSKLQDMARGKCRFVAEGFADRRYTADGFLVARSEHNAFVQGVTEAKEQLQWLLESMGVESICIHGDNPSALQFVKELRAELIQEGFTIQAFA